MENTEIKEVKIITEYITLGQLLKYENIISVGGAEKSYILTHNILVNGEDNKQRGKKLYPGCKVVIDNSMFFEIVKWLSKSWN